MIEIPGCSKIYILKSFADLPIFNSRIQDKRAYSAALSDPKTTGQIIVVLEHSNAYSTHRFDATQNIQLFDTKSAAGSVYTVSQGLFRITATSPVVSIKIPAALSPLVAHCPVTAADLAPGASAEVIGDKNKVTLTSFAEAKPKASGGLRI